MAHFTQIVNGKVTQVVVVANSKLLDSQGIEQESLGIAFLQRILGGEWVQTSFNATFRAKYAGIGDTYDPEVDQFFSSDSIDDRKGLEWLDFQ